MNRLMRAVACGAVAALGFAAPAFSADPPEQVDPPQQPAEEQPAAPAEESAEGAATVAPEAKELLKQVGQAYDNLKSLELAGTFTGEFDVAGQKQQREGSFTASFAAPGKFRHAVEGEATIGSTGEKVFVYLERNNQYLSTDAPKEGATLKEMNGPIPNILQQQNPSLMLAISGSAGGELTDGVSEITKAEDTKVGDKACPTLQLTLNDGSTLLLAVDPDTHLIGQSRWDLKAALEKDGAPDVKSALMTIEYTSVKPDAELKDEQFAWTPPAGAQDLSAAAAAANQGGGGEADPLEGQAAPDFTLEGLDGKAVTLSDLKGSVVVLDLWATWCGPCRASLPHLDKMYQANKEKGVKVFAVNLQEDKETVEGFVKETMLTVPVLMDTEGEVGGKYHADSIPRTIIIGKDGNVRKVFVGFGGDASAEAMNQAVDEANEEAGGEAKEDAGGEANEEAGGEAKEEAGEEAEAK